MNLVEIKDLINSNSGVLVIAALLVMTFIEIVPIKVSPWSAIFRVIGKTFNADLLTELSEVKKKQEQYIKKLEEHIELDDRRYMDLHRSKILQFNTELIRGLKHTKEDFTEILYNVDVYEKFCKTHPNYPNSRAVHAIANIHRVYTDLIENGGFLSADGE